LNAEGWNVEDVYFARTELTPQALAQNSIQISVNLYLEPLRTIQAGGPDSTLQFVMENNGAEFIIVAKAEYPTCQDMDGIRFGIHGETSTVSVAAVKWLNEECGVEPNVLVIPGGDNRIIALENDELDATLVQLGDWLALEAVADEGEYVIVDAGESMAFSGAGYFLNTDWLDENHDVAIAYIGELLRTYQIIHDDPTVLEEAVRANVEVPEETIAESVQLYLDPTLVNLAPIDPLGGSSGVLQATIDYFTPDELDEGLDINDFYDPALLEEAIAYLEGTS
jgi:ABC-type nitrate/sulfonate/bicarbonate transport system substrate-binding protein